MVFRRLSHKILAMVAMVFTAGLVATAWFFTSQEEQSILAENKRAMHKVTESVIRSLEALMIAGHANIAQKLSERLKTVPDVADFRILRINGREAFRDNATILDVNRRLNDEAFAPRPGAPLSPQIVSPETVSFLLSVKGREANVYYEKDSQGQNLVTMMDPILNQEACYRCHGAEDHVRGVVKLTMSLAPVEKEILSARIQSMVVLGVALLATLLVTGFILGRSVVRPIEKVTDAMVSVSHGDLGQNVPVKGEDELAQMASSFNVMANELKNTYSGLQQEQDKLNTIIQSAGEGIVVTDPDGQVVLVNSAAVRLLGKTEQQIVEQGFPRLFDDPEVLERHLAGLVRPGETVEYNGRILSVQAATIRNNEAEIVGSAALMRDVTQEKRLESELRRQSHTDSLTGLYNRRYLDDTLKLEWERSRRYGLHLSVLMIDVDHFKRFNDQHGHEMGDTVLKAVAEVLRSALRSQDYPCRYGGEEFLAILPNTGSDGAAEVAERLRAGIEAMTVEGLRVTVSIGVASLPETPAANADELVERADAMLYRAKNLGRNQVCVARLSLVA